MRLSALSILAFAVAIVAMAAPCAGQTLEEQTEFKKARYAYASKSFDEADQMFRAMLDPRTGTVHDKVLVNDARMYWGATLIAKGRKPEAIEQFDQLLASDSKYEPDPTVFPLEVGRVFIDAQALYKKKLIEAEEEAKLREKQRREQEEAARKAQTERMRSLETLVTQEHIVDHHSRWKALLPFGVGQFQNGKTGLGVFFLSTESLLLAGALITVPIYLTQLHDVAAAYQAPQDEPIAQAYTDRANLARYTNLVFNGALALTIAVGVLEAEVNYTPDVSIVRTRTMPDLPGVSPDAKDAKGPAVSFWSVAPVVGEGRGGLGGGGVTGAVIGVGGRF